MRVTSHAAFNSVDAVGTAVYYYDGRWVGVDGLWLHRGAGFHLIDLCPTVAAGRVVQMQVELRGIPDGFERRTFSDGSPAFDHSLLELVDRAARRGASSAVFHVELRRRPPHLVLPAAYGHVDLPGVGRMLGDRRSVTGAARAPA